MSYTIKEESFTSLSAYWSGATYNLRWNSVFVLPAWLQTWWQMFGSEADLYLRSVWKDKGIVGVAPLLVRGETASIVGSGDVCDYLDFIVAPGREQDFFTVLLDGLEHEGIKYLELGSLRPDSTVLTDFAELAEQRGCQLVSNKIDVSLELDLPSTWDDYLAVLTGKQRHELKRKLRRLREAGSVDYHCVKVNRDSRDLMDTFLELFSLSREDKADFMTGQMESFFRLLAGAMAEIGLLRFGILELDSIPVAMTMGFDYNGTAYLYNSGYHPGYSYLSVGLLSKALGIKDSIQMGSKKWDFLRGGESYKYDLGGREVPLYTYHVTIK